MADLIQPRTLQGFRDYPPELMIPREQLMEKARKVYRSYGFAPIDTPALEYTEILLGKGGAESDKQLYRFTDHGGRDVALRFDLTVPFARFAAQYIPQLGTPFKRYHLAPVWRGERPQRGRYREFVQCDFDTIGTTSNASDIEVALVIHDLMREIGFERFEVRINNRLLLNGLLEELGLAGQTTKVLRALDKLPKIGVEAVLKEMIDPGEGTTEVISFPQAKRLIDLVLIEGTCNAEILDRLERNFRTNSKAAEGIARLSELLQVARKTGIAEGRLRLDLSIARGLDYYTGTIYETFLGDLPDIGSVCSGGRYDNLAGLYTKRELPGVGASLGLDRLLAAMETLNLLPKVTTPAPVFIPLFSAEPDRLADYQRMARWLRSEGIGVEVYPELTRIGPQLRYADRRGFQVALIAGPDEFQQRVWNIKDLRTQQQIEHVPEEHVRDVVLNILRSQR
jgi:histidyl-tRNA synthetase